MADGIQIPIDAVDNFSATFTKALGGIGSIGSSAIEAAAGFGVFGGSISAVAELIARATDAAAESETVNSRLDSALRSTGRTADISSKQLDDMAVSLEKVSTFDDEKIKSAYQSLTQFENIPTSQFNNITKAAMNMSAAFGGDLASNAEAVGRVLETGVIPRSWGFSTALKEQIKNQVAAGDTAGALSTMLDQLNTRYGGQATAQLNTYAGAQERLKNAQQDYMELLGNSNLQGGTAAQLATADAIQQTIDRTKMEQEAILELGYTSRMTGAQRAKVEELVAQKMDEATKATQAAALANSAMTKDRWWEGATAGVITTSKAEQDYLAIIKQKSDAMRGIISEEELYKNAQKYVTDELLRSTDAESAAHIARGRAADSMRYGAASAHVYQKGLINVQNAANSGAGAMQNIQHQTENVSTATDGAANRTDNYISSLSNLMNQASDTQTPLADIYKTLLHLNGYTSSAFFTLYVNQVGSVGVGSTVLGGNTLPGNNQPAVAAAGGADFIVPAGYPNDSFPMAVQSGEHVKVTPAGQADAGGSGMTFNFYGTVNLPSEINGANIRALTGR